MTLQDGRDRSRQSQSVRESSRAPSSCPGAWWRTRLACDRGQRPSESGVRLLVDSVWSCHFSFKINLLKSVGTEKGRATQRFLFPLNFPLGSKSTTES